MQNIIINKQLLHVIISIIAAFLFYQLCGFLYNQTQFGLFRIFGGGGLNIALLKVLMYMGFFYGTLEVLEKRRNLMREYEGFNLNLLPTQEQMILSPAQVENIKLAILQQQKSGTFFILLDFIKKACTQFRNNQDIIETLQVLESQFTSAQDEHEGNLETTRYIVSTIPMLGFIGTIVELTGSLVLIPYIHKDNGMSRIADAMYSAFDATVVALLLTMILTFFYHKLIGDMDVFYGKTKSYIINNLISRIYKGK
jgi:biopolymer transport protein ExbB/TolQ